MMIMKIISAIDGFFDTTLFENSWFFLNIWSFIHLFFGGLIIWILNKFKLKYYGKYMILLTLLVLWEVFEFILYGVSNPPIIEGEYLKDVIWDIIIGMIGGLFADLYMKYFSYNKKRRMK